LAEDMKALGQSMVIEKLLTVLDNCDLARKYIKDESALMGFNMMEQQIISALSSFGLEEIDAADKAFDVKLMNAVETEKVDGKEGMVLEVISKGFTLNGKLLRAAGVKVGKEN
ncbi:MAG: nucleotide exchange factor GrpE, partial [Clostridia bacterium]|nr:nucleotide exchange factor GrpE [Clostridia bacterium]